MFRRLGLLIALLLVSLWLGPWLSPSPARAQTPPAPAGGQQGRPEVHPAADHGTSPPLRGLPPVPEPPGPRQIPVRPIPPPSANQPDHVEQSAPGPAVSATSGHSFAGVGNGDYGFRDQYTPPDTNMAVGDTQIVQWVNASFAVFDKSGTKLYGPAAGNTLWQSMSNGCATNNDGDPIAQYDKLAQRWVMTQFSVSTTPYLQCVAVSQSDDATGAWNLYSFDYGNTQFPDYPKLSVWPDAYYISYNIFTDGNFWDGAKVCAFNRAAMLADQPASQTLQQCYQLSTSYGSLLAGDLDGAASPPPAGEPETFLSFGTNSLLAWQFHVDWTNTANTTFTGPASISVAAFTPACNGGGTCIPQPATSQRLDSLADRLMYRLAYRNLNGTETLVVNHSVTASRGQTGVRWYELTGSSGSWSVSQQGTYAPDTASRWMGSIAMDQAGDIALGYSVSSSGISCSTGVCPSIRYTGRVPADSPGTMESETTIKAGSGSSTGSYGYRWGDYSAMRVDPSDECTFWYTNEYLKSTGSFNWSTWIGSFRFPSCGGGGGGGGTATPPGSFTVSASAASSTSANVSWMAPTPGTTTSGPASITGYTVASNPSVSGSPISEPASATSMTFSGLAPSTSYTFTVTATNSASLSTQETSNSITTQASGGGTATAPGAPANVSVPASGVTTTSAGVSWTAPSNTGTTSTGATATISSYTVTATPTSGSPVTATSSTASATLSGLTANMSYSVTVTATNSASLTGPASSPAIPFTTLSAATAPGAPASVTAALASGTSATVTWTPPASTGTNADGSTATISSYTVTASPSAGTPVTVSGSTSTTVSGLTAGTAYTFTVTATNSANLTGPGATSNSVTPVVSSMTISGQVSGLALATSSATIVPSLDNVVCNGSSFTVALSSGRGSFSNVPIGCGVPGQAVTFTVNNFRAGVRTSTKAPCLAYGPGAVSGLQIFYGGTPDTSCATASPSRTEAGPRAAGGELLAGLPGDRRLRLLAD